jgi:hypothetical protein
MIRSNNTMYIALTISAVFIMFNILAISQGNAQSYIGLIAEFVIKLLS